MMSNASISLHAQYAKNKCVVFFGNTFKAKTTMFKHPLNTFYERTFMYRLLNLSAFKQFSNYFHMKRYARISLHAQYAKQFSWLSSKICFKQGPKCFIIEFFQHLSRMNIHVNTLLFNCIKIIIKRSVIQAFACTAQYSKDFTWFSSKQAQGKHYRNVF